MSYGTRRRTGATQRVSLYGTVPALGLIAVLVLASSCNSNMHVARSPTTAQHSRSSTSVVSSTATPATTARSLAPTITSAVHDVSLRHVNWAGVRYPIDCQGGQTEVRNKVEYAIPSPGIQVAVVQVSCHVEATTPPSALLVYEPAGRSLQPRLVQELVSYVDGWLFNTYSTAASDATANVAGYSSDLVERATPDINITLKWTWSGSRYQLLTPVPTHLPFCTANPCTPTTATGHN